VEHPSRCCNDRLISAGCFSLDLDSWIAGAKLPHSSVLKLFGGSTPYVVLFLRGVWSNHRAWPFLEWDLRRGDCELFKRLLSICLFSFAASIEILFLSSNIQLLALTFRPIFLAWIHWLLLSGLFCAIFDGSLLRSFLLECSFIRSFCYIHFPFSVTGKLKVTWGVSLQALYCMHPFLFILDLF
jgi:hypothetical protein